jgi:hypothetical protein
MRRTTISRGACHTCRHGVMASDRNRMRMRAEHAEFELIRDPQPGHAQQGKHRRLVRRELPPLQPRRFLQQGHGRAFYQTLFPPPITFGGDDRLVFFNINATS